MMKMLSRALMWAYHIMKKNILRFFLLYIATKNNHRMIVQQTEIFWFETPAR